MTFYFCRVGRKALSQETTNINSERCACRMRKWRRRVDKWWCRVVGRVFIRRCFVAVLGGRRSSSSSARRPDAVRQRRVSPLHWSPGAARQVRYGRRSIGARADLVDTLLVGSKRHQAVAASAAAAIVHSFVCLLTCRCLSFLCSVPAQNNCYNHNRYRLRLPD